jgi:hypothetical protein
MEHSVDLSAHHFIQEISPSTAWKVIAKNKVVLQDADLNSDLDNLDTRLADFGSEGLDDSDESKANNHGVILDIADSVGKALALVKQVRRPHRQ